MRRVDIYSLEELYQRRFKERELIYREREICDRREIETLKKSVEKLKNSLAAERAAASEIRSCYNALLKSIHKVIT